MSRCVFSFFRMSLLETFSIAYRKHFHLDQKAVHASKMSVYNVSYSWQPDLGIERIVLPEISDSVIFLKIECSSMLVTILNLTKVERFDAISL